MNGPRNNRHPNPKNTGRILINNPVKVSADLEYLDLQRFDRISEKLGMSRSAALRLAMINFNAAYADLDDPGHQEALFAG